MSIRVDILIAPSGHTTRRTLEVHRVTNLDRRTGADDVNKYVATFGHPNRAANATATFEHRFGDDVLELITGAIAALRDAGMERA